MSRRGEVWNLEKCTYRPTACTTYNLRFDSPKLELVLVMVVAPALLNAVRFWLNDVILMSRLGGHSSYKKIEAYS